MAKYDWKVEPRDEDWSDDTYTYFLIHINLKRMVEYLTKEFKKDWWFKADYGQDNCYIVAENNNFPVRLFFTFEESGWADITRHYTDGATLKDDHLGSWHFAKYDVDYSYKNATIAKEIILGGGIVNLDDYIEVPLVLQLAEENPDKVIKIGLRCNFNVNDGVTSRFGFDVAKDSFRNLIATLTAKENISIAGIQCHFATRAIETWQPRAEGISKIAKEYLTDIPSHIDLGGGMFGKMKESLKEQFSSQNK